MVGNSRQDCVGQGPGKLKANAQPGLPVVAYQLHGVDIEGGPEPDGADSYTPPKNIQK
jgi:hypothetical protein